MRPISRRTRRSAQLIDAVANAEVDAVADSKVTARSGETIIIIIIRMGVEMIM